MVQVMVTNEPPKLQERVRFLRAAPSGCSSAWSEHSLWERGAEGSNPSRRTIFNERRPTELDQPTTGIPGRTSVVFVGAALSVTDAEVAEALGCEPRIRGCESLQTPQLRSDQPDGRRFAGWFPAPPSRERVAHTIAL